jgi:hypothetical protein
MEVDKVEEMEPHMTIRAVSLPVISMVLKKAWKANHLNLEKTRVVTYLCWIQGVTRVAYVDNVEQFISIVRPNPPPLSVLVRVWV